MDMVWVGLATLCLLATWWLVRACESLQRRR